MAGSQSLLAASSILAIIYLAFHYLKVRSKALDLPIYGKSQQDHYYDSISVGGKEGNGMPFQVPAYKGEDPLIILDTRYLNDIKSLPLDTAAFDAGVYKQFHGRYTGIGELHAPMIQAVKVDLTRNIARTLNGLQDEADFAIPATIGECDDWTPVNFYSATAHIVAHLSARIFVGEPLCRNEDWLRSTIDYTMDSFKSVPYIDKLNPLVRPIKAWSVPELQRVLKHRESGKNLIAPIIEARLEAMKFPNYEPTFDMIEFMINNSADKDKWNVYQQVIYQLTLSLAAIHTTTMNASMVMYDLCAHPEYIQPLREELETMLAEDSGKFVKTNMNKLKKLDSFIKESQRLNPPAMTSLQRLVLKDLTLHDGLHIPKGRLIAFNAIQVNRDPDLYPNPNEFDGFRFSKLRELPENANKYQLVTTGPDAISFGHGAHACPGRFFASNEIKILLAGIILRYDFSLVKGGGRADRPRNIYRGTSIRPDDSVDVWFRRRTLA